jgi:hypothetical protein
MTASLATRTVVYLVQTRSDSGEWHDTGEFGVGKGRGVHTVANCVLHAQAGRPRQHCRVLAWDAWTVQHLLGCDPYPEHDHPATQLAWIYAMRKHVPPHADITSADRS